MMWHSVWSVCVHRAERKTGQGAGAGEQHAHIHTAEPGSGVAHLHSMEQALPHYNLYLAKSHTWLQPAGQLEWSLNQAARWCKWPPCPHH